MIQLSFFNPIYLTQLPAAADCENQFPEKVYKIQHIMLLLFKGKPQGGVLNTLGDLYLSRILTQYLKLPFSCLDLKKPFRELN